MASKICPVSVGTLSEMNRNGVRFKSESCPISNRIAVRNQSEYARIAVVFVAHAGRNGFMRGTSRREDAAFWMIELSEPREGTNSEGARFVTRFVKNRNSTEQDCPPLLWHIVKCKEKSHADILCEPLSVLYAFRQQVEQGLTSASEIAAAMGVSKGQVSKLAKQAIAQGWLTKVGRRYGLASQD